MAITLSTSGAFVSGTTAVDNDGVVRVDTSGGAETVTLPAGAYNGFKFSLVRDGASSVVVSAASGETLNGANILSTDLDRIEFVKVGGEWVGYESTAAS